VAWLYEVSFAAGALSAASMPLRALFHVAPRRGGAVHDQVHAGTKTQVPWQRPDWIGRSARKIRRGVLPSATATTGVQGYYAYPPKFVLLAGDTQ